MGSGSRRGSGFGLGAGFVGFSGFCGSAGRGEAGAGRTGFLVGEQAQDGEFASG